MEKEIIIWLQSKSSTFLDLFFSAWSYVVSWIGVVFLFLVIIVFIDKKFGLFFGIGFLITILINYILKVIINRPRPYETYDIIVNKLSTIGKSFPSGHAVSVTFMMLTILFVFNILHKKEKFKIWQYRWFKIISIALSLLFVFLTMIARMYLGQHYLTDLIAGISLSAFCFMIIFALYLKTFFNKNNI